MIEEILLRLQGPRRSGKSVTVDSEAVLKDNPGSTLLRVSDKFDISQSNVVGKSIQSC